MDAMDTYSVRFLQSTVKGESHPNPHIAEGGGIMIQNFFLILMFIALQNMVVVVAVVVESGSTEFPDYTTTPVYDDVNSKGTKSVILEKLFKDSGYDKELRPPGMVNGTGPTNINISLFIRSIENIDDVKMQYSVQLTFRQEWIDPRLQFRELLDANSKIDALQLMTADRIWMPDVFFSNEKDGSLHTLMIPNFFTRLYQDGRVLQSYRITLLLSCPMNLHSYPLDVQRCPIQMASYGWTTQDILLKWRKDQPIDMARDFNMPRFRMQEHVYSECTTKTVTGRYSCIKLEISFEREFGFYLIQIYIPCSMLSLVSWVSFWLEPKAVEARVSLGVTTILAIVTQTYGINQSAPPASYVKAMDVWTAFCQIMVFGALLEFALVNYIAHFRISKRKKKNAPFNDTSGSSDAQQQDISVDNAALKRAKRVDLIARVVFPLAFVIFNIGYWGYYMNLYYGIVDDFKEGISKIKEGF